MSFITPPYKLGSRRVQDHMKQCSHSTCTLFNEQIIHLDNMKALWNHTASALLHNLLPLPWQSSSPCCIEVLEGVLIWKGAVMQREEVGCHWMGRVIAPSSLKQGTCLSVACWFAQPFALILTQTKALWRNLTGKTYFVFLLCTVSNYS